MIVVAKPVSKVQVMMRVIMSLVLQTQLSTITRQVKRVLTCGSQCGVPTSGSREVSSPRHPPNTNHPSADSTDIIKRGVPTAIDKPKVKYTMYACFVAKPWMPSRPMRMAMAKVTTVREKAPIQPGRASQKLFDTARTRYAKKDCHRSVSHAWQTRLGCGIPE
jgi:hypothetical protein